MAPSAWWRRVRRHFSIDAPRMAVRSHVPWPWRAVAGMVLVIAVAGMWWWGFDFGQIFGGFNRKELETQLESLGTENAKLRSDAAQLAAANARQESEIAIMAGAQATLTKQALDLQRENSQIREELAFLQKLVADSTATKGLLDSGSELNPRQRVESAPGKGNPPADVTHCNFKTLGRQRGQS